MFARIFVRRYFFVGLAACCVLAAGAWVAYAAQGDEIPRVIHYEGYLEKNGVPVDTTAAGAEPLAAEFLLDNGTDDDRGTSFYRYPAGNLVITQGRFVVDIGAAIPGVQGQEPLPSWVFDQAGHIYLTVRLNGADMRGRQKLAPVPFAVRAAEAVDFNVKGSLVAAGTVSAGGVISNGGISAAREISAPSFGVRGLNPAIGFTNTGVEGNYWILSYGGALHFTADTDGDRSMWEQIPLILNKENASFGGNVQIPRLSVQGEAAFEGPVRVPSLTVAGGAVPHSCEWLSGQNDGRSDLKGMACPAGKKIVSGGCSLRSGALRNSLPDQEMWVCQADTKTLVTAFAYCCS